MREGVREGERGCERVIASLRMYTVGHMQAREIRGRSEGDQREIRGRSEVDGRVEAGREGCGV